MTDAAGPAPARPGRLPGVSVVIPTRDRRDLLSATLVTVLGQREVDLEVIVVDDGSLDGTAAHVRDLGDARVRVVRHQRALGVSAARNRGLAEVSMPLVAFTDDDDLWAPDKLATQAAAMSSDGAARWSCGGAVVVNEHLRLIRQQRPWPARDVAEILLERNIVPGGASGVMAEMQLVTEVGGFDERLSVFADWDLWIRLALESPVAPVDRPLHAYRLHGGGMSTTMDARDELGLLETKYAAVRADRGLTLERSALEVWMGDRSQRAGRRWAAARSYLRSVPRISRGKSILKTTEVLIWPELGRVRDRINGWRVDPEWRHEVAAWLGQELRSAPRPSPPPAVPALGPRPGTTAQATSRGPVEGVVVPVDERPVAGSSGASPPFGPPDR